MAGRWTAAASGASSVEGDCHRAVVDEADRHPCAEDPTLHRNAMVGQRSTELFVDRLRLGGRCSVREAGPIPFPRVCDQRELADDERRAAGVEEAAVELAAGVLEDAQPRDLAGQARYVRRTV